MTPTIPSETYRRVHDCLQCEECGESTAIATLGMRHKRGCRATGGVLALNPREKQMALLIADGKGTKEMADVLGISDSNVCKSRFHLYRRLGINKSAQLVTLLYESGILKPKAAQ